MSRLDHVPVYGPVPRPRRLCAWNWREYRYIVEHTFDPRNFGAWIWAISLRRELRRHL